VARSPEDARRLAEGAAAGVPRASIRPGAPTDEIGAQRVGEAKRADPVGGRPQPGHHAGSEVRTRGEAGARIDPSDDGPAADEISRLEGDKGRLFLDLLGERLAFERTSVRLYEALMVKLESADNYPGRPTQDELVRLRDQELAHFHLLTGAIERLGGDPTQVTPSADVSATTTAGALEALGDPRTSLLLSLKVMVGMELVDKDAWETLQDLAERFGLAATARVFQRSADKEEEQLAVVRTWLARCLEAEAGIEREVPPEPAPTPAPPSAP
jgi:hypothetical protein